MNYFFNFLAKFTLILLLFTGCETTLEENPDNDSPFIAQLSVSPMEVSFDRETDHVKDTTITIDVSGQVKQLTENTELRYSLTNVQNEELLDDGNFDLSSISPGIGNFDDTISLEVSTSTINNYLISVIVTNNSGNGNYAQVVLKVNGISGLPPTIIAAANPADYTIPESGTENVRFTAKVTDPDGQDNVEGVFLRLFSRTTGEVNNSPFELFDDGQSMGDQAEGDSLYTLTFPVSSDNQPDTYDVHYYAIDRSALVSDTVKTTFTLVE
jgi:hypothetical protein